MQFQHEQQGVCSHVVEFELNDDHTVHNVVFHGGCKGNLSAISKLCEGMKAEALVETLKGNTCGPRPTSCADQFARGLEEALESIKQ